jgi:hypothetical protein
MKWHIARLMHAQSILNCIQHTIHMESPTRGTLYQYSGTGVPCSALLDKCSHDWEPVADAIKHEVEPS